jgi:hypothetical protein
VCAPPQQTAPRENLDASVDEREVVLFRAYYSSLMYKVSCADSDSGLGVSLLVHAQWQARW